MVENASIVLCLRIQMKTDNQVAPYYTLHQWNIGAIKICSN